MLLLTEIKKIIQLTKNAWQKNNLYNCYTLQTFMPGSIGKLGMSGNDTENEIENLLNLGKIAQLY